MVRRQFLAQAGAACLACAAPVDVRGKAWKAQWVYPRGADPNDYGVYHFRRAFELQAVPQRLQVHATGDSRYELFVNGTRVATGPARGDLFHWRYETLDLAPHLRAGRNVVAAVVWNDGPAAAVAQWSNRTAFLLQAADPDFEFLNTGRQWKWIRNEAYTCVPVPTYQPTGYYAIGPMERVEAAQYPWGWQEAGFDDTGWAAVEVGPNASPRDQRDAPARWMLVPRPIPLMGETPQRLAKVRQASGAEVPAGFPAQPAPFTIGAGKKVVLLLDQGHLTCAYPELEVSGGKGARITLGYAEALFAQMSPRRMKGNRNEVEGKQFIGYADTLVCDGGKRMWRPLFWRTYRYMKVEIETAGEPLTIEDLRGAATGYPFEVKAKFDSGVELHRRMWETGWRTAQLCAHETYMDCPYYEQLQYAGDTRIQSLVSLFMTGDGRLMRNAIEQIDSSRTPEGATFSRAPSVLQQYIPPFCLWWVGMVHDYWRYVDDPAFVREMLGGVRAVLGFYERYLKPDGLLGAMPWWNYVDWVDGFENGRPPSEPHVMPAAIQLQYVLALRWAAELENALGDPVFARRDAAMAARLAEAVRKSFWNAGRRMYSEDLAQTKYSQHANVLAVLAGLAAGEGGIRDLMQRVESDRTLARCSVYFRYYLDRAMVEAGLGDRYLERLGTWEFMLKEGLTTWAEIDSPYTRSDCHAWGASPNIEFLRTVLGVDSAGPGFSKITVKPHLGPLQKVSGVVPHPKGVIRVTVERQGRGYKLDVKAPAGVEVAPA
jgi:hypothetical protein